MNHRLKYFIVKMKDNNKTIIKFSIVSYEELDSLLYCEFFYDNIIILILKFMFLSIRKSGP